MIGGEARKIPVNRYKSIQELEYRPDMIPTVYVITPTKRRLEQKADLTRLSQTLRQVPNLHWILVEDNANKSRLISNLLVRSQLPFTHLNISTPPHLRVNKIKRYPTKGVEQRNGALRWIRKHANLSGVVYFADDDNTYDLQIFEEMRYTKKISVWPVGLVALQRYVGPIVVNGTVTRWLAGFDPDREFGTDMAGFAVNVKLLIDIPMAEFRDKPSHLETDFLSQLHIIMKDLEPKADNCTKVLVWHTRTVASSLDNDKKLQKIYGFGTDTNIEV